MLLDGKNQAHTLTITDLNSQGQGVGRLNDGRVVFVPFALQGEEVLVCLTQIKKNYALGQLIKIVKKSPLRVVPPCPVFGSCGGCDLQHLDYNAQLKFKTQLIVNQLKKIALTQAVVQDCRPCALPYFYRNKASFKADSDLRIGFYGQGSHNVVDVKQCLICSDGINKAYKKIRERGVNGFKSVTIRELNGVAVTEFDKNPTDKRISGKICGKICGLDVEVSLRAFLQVNSAVAQMMYSDALSLAGATKDDIIIDAYGGIGILSALFAPVAFKVFNIEIVKEATDDASKLMHKNNINNVQILTGDCLALLPKLLKKLHHEEGDKRLTIVLDPPRNGCAPEVLSCLLRAQPHKIIYISCNSATLCRDLKTLTQKYKIDTVIPYDMFPQTADVETLAYLTKKA